MVHEGTTGRSPEPYGARASYPLGVKVFLVRHADAGDRERWTGDDRSRPLSERGTAQARGLVRELQDEGIEQVMSSPYLRCIQTVEPLAAARGLGVRSERLLAEGSDPRQTLELICDTAGPAAMCSQGDVIGGVVSQLADWELIEPDRARWQKGSTWVLEIRDGRVAAATYLPPLED
jgi:broad specificity phosphatase PhoE